MTIEEAGAAIEKLGDCRKLMGVEPLVGEGDVALHQDGRLDILRAIRDGRLTMLQVSDAYRRRTLQELPVGEALRPLAGAMTTWIQSLIVPRDYSRKHVQSLETSRRDLERARSTAIVADLPDLLEGLREALGREHLVRSRWLAAPRSLSSARR